MKVQLADLQKSFDAERLAREEASKAAEDRISQLQKEHG